MNAQPTSLEATVRLTRTIHLVLLVSIPVYFLVGEMLVPAEPRGVSLIWRVITAAALLNIAFAVVYWKRVRKVAEEMLRLKPDDTIVLGRWRVATIVSLAICESLALFGLALRFLGATTLEAAPFFAVAFVLTLAFRPVVP